MRRAHPSYLAAALWLIGAAQAEPLYEAGKAHWLAAEYQPAYDALLDFRQQPYGRRPEVDYMLGTSGCRMAGKQQWGARVLRYTLYNYPLVESSRALVKRELALCQAATEPLGPLAASQPGIDSFVAAGASGSGKLYAPADRANPVLTYPARRVRELPPGELVARRIALDQADAAIAMVKRLAPGLPSVATSARFVLASSAGHSSEQLRQIGRQLARYLDFLQRTYQIELPDRYIAIYLVPGPADLGKLARSLHGLDMGPHSPTIGYTFRDDQSAVAVVSGMGIGTLFHELYHLTVHRGFGDIPQWLDEGIASLYEVSAFYGDALLGEPNWRGKVIDLFAPPQRRSVRQIISSDWFPFDVQELTRDTDGVGRATMALSLQMAVNRYLMLYLQERGLLPTVYSAFRDRDPGNVLDDPALDTVARFEGVVGQPIDAFSRDFERWLDQVQKQGLKRNAAPDLSIRKYEPPPPPAQPGSPPADNPPKAPA